MTYLFYVRLIGLTAGTLTYLFLLALIVGHRRPRLLERLLFFVVLSLFLMCAGGLLELNAFVHYGNPPPSTRWFANLLVVTGLWFLAPLIFFTHVEYKRVIAKKPLDLCARIGVWVMSLIVLAEFVGVAIISHGRMSFGTGLLEYAPIVALPKIAFSSFAAAALPWTIIRDGRDPIARRFGLGLSLLGGFLLFATLARIFFTSASPIEVDLLVTITILGAVVPADLFRLETQLSRLRSAEEPRVCAFGYVFGAAVFSVCAAD